MAKYNDVSYKENDKNNNEKWVCIIVKKCM